MDESKPLMRIADCGLRIFLLILLCSGIGWGQPTKVGLSQDGQLIWSPAFKDLVSADFDPEGRLLPIWSYSHVPRLQTAGSKTLEATDVPYAVYKWWIPDGRSIVTSPIPSLGFTRAVVDVVVIDTTSAYSQDPLVTDATAAILADVNTQQTAIFKTVGYASREFGLMAGHIPRPASEAYYAARLPETVSPEASTLSTQYVNGPMAAPLVSMVSGALTWDGAGRQKFEVDAMSLMLYARSLVQSGTVAVTCWLFGEPQ